MQYIANHSEYAEDALLHKVLSQRIVITNNAMTAFATSTNGKIAIENNETIKYTVMNSELGAVKMLAGYIGINVDAVKDLKEFSQLFGNSTYTLQMVNNNNCLNILLNYNLPASKWPYSLPMINAFMTSENALTLMADSQIAMSNVVRSSDAMVNFATHGIAMREIATSEIAMFALMTTTEAIRRTILSKDTPVNAFAISPTAMQIIANDKEWMDDICSIETAINGFIKVENSMNAFLANDLVAEVSMIDEPTGTTRAAILNNVNNIAMPRVLSDPTMMKKITGNATWMAAIAADSDWMDAAAANETAMKAFMNDSNAETKLIENTVVAMKEILENTSVAMDIVLTDVSMLEAIGNN